jgi:hypothetical protein
MLLKKGYFWDLESPRNMPLGCRKDTDIRDSSVQIDTEFHR